MNRQLQAFTLAHRYLSKDQAKQEQEADPLTAPIKLSNEVREAARSIIQEKKKHLSESASQFKREWTEEEKVKIAAMNEELIDEVIGYGGQEALQALESLHAKKEASKSARALATASSTSTRQKSSQPPSKRSKKSNHAEDTKDVKGAKAGAGVDVDVEDADNEIAPQRYRRA
ncbi:uncharacterized protein JCM6883_007291 [Sporobolomyces salmoneus]|uniref:uncharacterized protein n=1 Tax=Sporobolomyces salmoneus TaxID=183962 RepID=UPI0031790085